MEFLQVVANVLIGLERLFELIIQFGEAWSAPLVAFVVAWLVLKFRSPIIGVFGRLREFEAAGIRFKLDAELRTDLNRVQERRRRLITARTTLPPIEAQVEVRVRSSSRGIIIDAWLGIEAMLSMLAEVHGIIPSQPPSRAPFPVIEALLDHNVIDADLEDVILDMRRIRNNVAHVHDFSPNEEVAQEYAEEARQIVATLKERLPE